MNANKALWERGDFTRIARLMRDAGQKFVDRLDVTRGMQVLDVGSGDGTTALPAAERGANVLAVDIASNLVEAGARRAREAGLTNLHFEQGDACDLSGIPDDRFDLAISVFGAMFAPQPDAVAKELVRVVKSGGRIAMANWIPGDPTLVAQMLGVVVKYAPPPAGAVSPMRWGEPSVVAERFAKAGIAEADIHCEREVTSICYPGEPAELLQTFIEYYGPVMNAFDVARANGAATQLEAELRELFERCNESGSSERTEIRPAYLRVVVDV